VIFDLLSSEYGWTTNDILKLTMREVSWRSEAIHTRQIDNYKLDAQLQGHELKLDKENRPEGKTAHFRKG